MKRALVGLLIVGGWMVWGDAFQAVQVFRPERFSRGDTNLRVLQPIDEAAWIWLPGHDRWGAAAFNETRPDALQNEPSTFVRFRKRFAAIAGEPLEIDVSADERYVLMLDGREISRGPHRGLVQRWHYQSYRISNLAPGEHLFEAVCWQLGAHAPLAQVSVRGGFILKAAGRYDAALTTGKTDWEVAELHNTRMTDKGNSGAFGVGSQCEVRGSSCLDERPADSAYQKAVEVRKSVSKGFGYGLIVQGWMLFPTILHDMMFERKVPGRICRGPDVLKPGTVIPPRTQVKALWALGNYYCAYPFLSVHGGKGAKIRWGWTECLTGKDGQKGDRGAFDGLEFTTGIVDTFLPDGRQDATFTTPWWRCGKWCQIEIETADEPLAIAKVDFAETRYPVELEASFECDDPLIMALQPICARALEMCMHEMFFDCPFYEQQMYPGDGRLHFQTAGLFDLEDRLVRHAITLYDTDRRENGMIAMNCPTRGTQDALGFTSCEVMMYRDYLMNHTNVGWLKARLPGMNHTLMGFEAFTREDGLLGATPGWNFVDWVPQWRKLYRDPGVPPDGDGAKPNAEINLQYLKAVLSAEACERAVGENHLADHWKARAERLKTAIRTAFWRPERALFASQTDLDHPTFSEHAQCLALLCDVVTGEEAQRCLKALSEATDLDRGTIYYKHYLFETFIKFGRADLVFKNLGFWKNCLDWHLATVLEEPWTTSRSDCHGWGAHPLYHLHTGIAGVQSAAPFYGRVRVAPQPAHLKWIRSSTPTPKGLVKLDLRFDDGKVVGTVTLPENLSGEFVWAGAVTPLHAGVNEVK